jgi:hypothetical protein
MSAWTIRPLGRRSRRALGGLALGALAVALSAIAGPAAADTIYGLTANNILLRFDSASPGTIQQAVVISGLQAGERIVGIDFRPRTGQLFAVGVVPGATDTIRLYTVKALTGQATLVPGSTSFTVTSGNSYGVDFNPTVDRLRVFNDGDENFRINPNNGARADTPTNDTDINPAGNQVEGAAYDRNFDTGLAVANRTTLYAISAANSSLVTIGGINQSPSPNGGAVQNSQALGITLSAAGEVGFDIPAGSSTGLASLRNNATGLTALYSINLGTGAATLVGSISNGAIPLTGLAAVPAGTLVTGAGPGGAPQVRVFNAQTATERFPLSPIPRPSAGACGSRRATSRSTGFPTSSPAPARAAGPTSGCSTGSTGPRSRAPSGASSPSIPPSPGACSWPPATSTPMASRT